MRFLYYSLPLINPNKPSNYSDALEICQTSPGSRTIGWSLETRQTPAQESGKITVHLQSWCLRDIAYRGTVAEQVPRITVDEHSRQVLFEIAFKESLPREASSGNPESTKIIGGYFYVAGMRRCTRNGFPWS